MLLLVKRQSKYIFGIQLPLMGHKLLFVPKLNLGLIPRNVVHTRPTDVANTNFFLFFEVNVSNLSDTPIISSYIDAVRLKMKIRFKFWHF